MVLPGLACKCAIPHSSAVVKCYSLNEAGVVLRFIVFSCSSTRGNKPSSRSVAVPVLVNEAGKR